MLRVAITGGPGSGKSTVRKLFEVQGARSIDLDGLAREVVRPGSAAFQNIVTQFGEEVVSADGGLDRKQLRRLISVDPQAKRTLEAIIHPPIQTLLKEKLSNIASMEPGALVVVEVPLLVEAGMEDQFDVIILVDADVEIQKNRIMERDHCTDKEAEALLELHLPSPKKGENAHFVIDNGGDMVQTASRVETVFREILQRFSNILTG